MLNFFDTKLYSECPYWNVVRGFGFKYPNFIIKMKKMIADHKSPFVETLLNTLAFGEVTLRIAALDMIRNYYEKELFGFLIQAVKDPNEKVRAKAIEILASVNDPRALDVIRSAKHDATEEVRE